MKLLFLFIEFSFLFEYRFQFKQRKFSYRQFAHQDNPKISNNNILLTTFCYQVFKIKENIYSFMFSN